MSPQYEVFDFLKFKDIVVHRLKFTVPLDYESPQGTKISIAASVVQKFSATLHADKKLNHSTLCIPDDAKLICYIQGGPGFPCAVPTSNSGYTKVLLDKGYSVVYLDQRGTGFSTPLEVGTINKYVAPKENETENELAARQLEFVLHFRADSIVEDLEHIRKDLLGEAKWSLIGQSYGGFTSFTYLSKYAEFVKEVFITGGVPPIGYTSDQVYEVTYDRTRERNEHYYAKYPEDSKKVREILTYLDNHNTRLPNGGNLSVERFQQLGINFGHFGGTDSIHQIVLKFSYELKLLGGPSYHTLKSIQDMSSFDTNIIYAFFLEAIYCDGNDSKTLLTNWSADRLRYAPGNEKFVFKKDAEDDQVYFFGEMIYKSIYDDFTELRPFKALGQLLHSNQKWSKLYDPEVLSKITWEKVPIVAATYVYDQYVDFDVTRQVKKNIFKNNGNLRQFITSEFFHDGVRADPEKVIGKLHDLLDGEAD
ncbi:alpha/beta-hydrolase [Suhomyces tanzawaensis NRRL Y-17324]|uniref:Alpha/beta-hydrolase n=1 Tax=Suhomyces tanzawaensis NRRL Y-17324 TaxID=984487 RepID=A0A1E4SKW3_9ASCO|nr:alpha/beta-hydrolase [Suhomyces tanzawaensis NRRL Y-17324]ODV80141.1 alpha/beta-hydrolase [Suhomyces tanzawaensis NRRL Y-17324]